MRKVLFLAVILIALAVSAQASPLLVPITSYINSNFPGGNVFETFSFQVLTQPQLVQIEALSYTGGGTNQYGAPIPAGPGFDNMLWLFAGSGSPATYIQGDDDSGVGFDALILRVLDPGTYTVAVTRWNYYFAGIVGDPLSTGFSGTGYSSTPNYVAVDVSSAIPEPMTFVLIGTGLLGLGILGRRRASK